MINLGKPLCHLLDDCATCTEQTLWGYLQATYLRFDLKKSLWYPLRASLWHRWGPFND